MLERIQGWWKGFPPASMDRRPEWGVRLLGYLFAGLEAGVLGGLAVFAWLGISCYWTGHSFWAVPAALGSALREDFSNNRQFGAEIAAGVALQFFVTGVLGMLFGLAVREGRNSGRVLIMGLLAGLAGYQLCHGVVLERAWLPPASSAVERPMLPAFLLFGFVLSLYPRLLRRVRQSLVLQD